MLHRLIFDTTDAASIAASANVGAYLRASDGTLLTHTGGALNVSFSTVTDLDIRDLDASQDNVAISDGTDTLAINNDGSINVVATATDLDIRDLDAAQDSVAAWLSDGSGNAISSTSGAIDVHIASGDLDDSLANTAMATGATSVDTTVGGVDLRATDLANRKWLYVYNNGNKEVFIGNSGVTAATGFPVPPGAMLDLRAGAAIDVFAISSNGTQNVRTLELS